MAVYNNIPGTSGNDTLIGSNDINVTDIISGLAGNDIIIGLAGNDSIDGGAGDDEIGGGDGNDTIYGGYGNDSINGGSGYDIATYSGQYSSYNATFLSDGKVQISGGEGTDLLTDIERISFGYGYYYIYTGDAANNTITADPTGWSLVYGGDGNDILTGTAGNDTLAGGNGDDKLYGASSYDLDHAVYFNSFDKYSFSFTTNGELKVIGSEGTDTLNGIDQLDFANGGLAYIYTATGAGNDVYYAAPNVTTLAYMGDGNDQVTGSIGNDTLDGGNGNDTAYYLKGISNYYPGLNRDGSVTVLGEGTDVLVNMEHIRFYDGAYYNIYTGDAADNTITAADPNVWSLLHGGNGNDTLTGSYGNDTMAGGNGNDKLFGGAGFDFATYFGTSGYDFSFTSTGDLKVTGPEGTDTLNGIERLVFPNGGYLNVHTGDGGNNTITADPNSWSLVYGGGGNDTLTGSLYTDTITGGSGYDVAIYNGAYYTYSLSFTSNGNVQVKDSQGTDLLNGVEEIFYPVHSAAVKIYTGDGNNNSLSANPNYWSMLYGGGGNDILTGGQFSDTLEGGAGVDQLTGGSGADQFKFGGSNGSPFGTARADVITDFVVGTDKIALGKTAFSSLLSSAGSSLLASEFAVVTSDSAVGSSSAKIVYNSVNGNVFYNQNGSGSGYGTGGLFVTLTGSPDNLSASSFLITAA